MAVNYFTIVLIVLDICAAVWEASHGHPAKCWYWASAASITTSVLFWK